MSDVRTTSRKTRVGKVVSDKMDKTVVVIVEDRVAHKTYKKIIGRTYRLKAHDENNRLKRELAQVRAQLKTCQEELETLRDGAEGEKK